ncbi:MAG: cysteine--tRNA ligase [Candidatus Omnitrophota bacterium]
MAIFIQNSLTKKKEEFIPQDPGEVKMYTCGVTVYDDCHVGHARSLFIFDGIKKYLEYRGHKVKLVRNITDVDDKIIKRSNEEGVPFEEIRQRYIQHYARDLKDLEIERADFEPKATENIVYMVDHIKQLIDKGHAYEVDGDVYFSVRSFSTYGRLSGQSIEEMQSAVRIEPDEKKKDPLDFALWKKSKDNEPQWDSPWGKGRPGWHIECSTMSMRFLRTPTLDIHAGGRDLIFPHHENEIAQAEALTGVPFARIWIHHGLLTIEGRKMSKSLGNFVTIQDVLKQHPPDVLKLFFLSAHYGTPIDFTNEGLKQTKKGYEKIGTFLDKINLLPEEIVGNVTAVPADVARWRTEFETVMDDDFNTAQAVACLFELLNCGNRYLSSKKTAEAVATAGVLLQLGRVLGLALKASGKIKQFSSEERVKMSEIVSLDPKDIQVLLEERRRARQKKDFKRADEIREFLKNNGIAVEDMEKLK